MVSFWPMARKYLLEDVRKTLKLRTIAQARNRVNLVKGDLVTGGSLAYGRNNRMEFTENGMALLKKMEEIAARGVTQREAAQAISVQPAAKSNVEARLRAVETELAALRRSIQGGFTISLTPKSD